MKLRKTGVSLWLVAASVLAGLGVIPAAQADSITDYTINFTTTVNYLGPTATPTGSFAYDNTTNQFTSFSVLYDGFTFNLTSSANNPGIAAGGPPCIGGATGPAASLALMTQCSTSSSAGSAQNPYPLRWQGGNGPNSGDAGATYFQIVDENSTVTQYIYLITTVPAPNPPPSPGEETIGILTSSVAVPTTTPEPSGFLMLGSGLLALFGIARSKAA